MSSEHDESTELLENLSVKSDAEKSETPKKGQAEHAKPRRKCRRGKRRKQRKTSGAAESENQEDSETHPETEANTPPWDSDEELDCETNAYSDVIIRPMNVPKAPENYSQFIIDDHNQCHLYMSFETPNPYISTDTPNTGEDLVLQPAGSDAAYNDIDFQYDPPQDFDNSAYYDKEFEMSYKSNRFDELLRLPRAELVSGLRLLEVRVKELSDDLVKENPSPILEKLQADLLELQEKHSVLKDSHTSLTALVIQNDKKAEDKTAPENHIMVNRSTVSEMDCLRRSSPETDGLGNLMSLERTLGKCSSSARLQSEGNLCPKSLGDSVCVSEVHSSIAHENVKKSPGHEDVTLGSAQEDVKSCRELAGLKLNAEVKSSCELERSVPRDLPCRDDAVTTDEHELKIPAVLV